MALQPYINFGADVLLKWVGKVVVLAEDTAFGGAITGLVTDASPQLQGSKSKMLSPMTLIP